MNAQNSRPTVNQAAPILMALQCTCEPGNILDDDGRSCKCGGVFTAASGSFSTPGWPHSYPQENECVWKVDLPILTLPSNSPLMTQHMV